MRVAMYTWWRHLSSGREFVCIARNPVDGTITLLEKYKDEPIETSEADFLERERLGLNKAIKRDGKV
jgi:sarcosine oxidase delta subunit